MLYELYQETQEGKEKFCMKNKDDGKSYCFDSEDARTEGMKMHEMKAEEVSRAVEVEEKTIKCGSLYFTAPIDRAAINEQTRTIPLSFSSETPLFDTKLGARVILDHSLGAIDMTRCKNGLAIRDGHIGDQVGIAREISFDGGCGRGMAKFSKGVRASEIYQDVLDEIRRDTSVRAEPHRLRRERTDPDGIDVYRAVKWAPIHIAIVPDGLDTTVGINREYDVVVETPKQEPEPPTVTVVVDRSVPADKGGKMDVAKCGTHAIELVNGLCPMCVKGEVDRQVAEQKEKTKKKNADIMALGQKYGQYALAGEFVSQDRSVEEFGEKMVEMLKSGSVNFQKEGGNKKTDTGDWASMGDFLRSVALAGREGATPDPRLILDRTAVSGMSEGVPSDGGFLLRDDWTTSLLTLAHETGILWSKCRRIPIGPGAKGLSAPTIDESTRATGFRFGGVQIYRDAEGNEATAKKVKFGKIELALKKLHGLAYATDEELEDVVQLESIVSGAFGEEFGFVVDDEIVRGDGASQMLGILNAACLLSIAEETGQVDDTIVADNIFKMYARMRTRSKANATWYINDECWPQIFGLYLAVGTGGVPIFLPPGGLSVAPYGSLMGRPIQPLEQCAGLGDVGDILFADMNQYLVIDKGSLDAKVSMHVRFIYDEQTFKWTLRINGQPIPKSVITPYKSTATFTSSPFVTIAAR